MNVTILISYWIGIELNRRVNDSYGDESRSGCTLPTFSLSAQWWHHSAPPSLTNPGILGVDTQRLRSFNSWRNSTNHPRCHMCVVRLTCCATDDAPWCRCYISAASRCVYSQVCVCASHYRKCARVSDSSLVRGGSAEARARAISRSALDRSVKALSSGRQQGVNCVLINKSRGLAQSNFTQANTFFFRVCFLFPTRVWKLKRGNVGRCNPTGTLAGQSIARRLQMFDVSLCCLTSFISYYLECRGNLPWKLQKKKKRWSVV